MFSYPRYLTAKASVDDRALNASVWNTFLDALDDRGSSVSLLEVGGGTGATLRRCLQAFPERALHRVHYTLVDEHADNLRTAQADTLEWAEEAGFHAISDSDGTLALDGPHGTEIVVQFCQDDLFEFKRKEEGRFDAVIAQAVADRYDPSSFVAALNVNLHPEGLWYLPIHFDGMTAFEPTIDKALDRQILDCYHQSMPTPQSGRALLTELRDHNAELLRVGASDWIVHARGDEYPKEEAYFLRCILYFVRKELKNNIPEISKNTISTWFQKRLHQIQNGDLVYLAHQLDLCAKKNK